jgi:hypothetical protein
LCQINLILITSKSDSSSLIGINLYFN